MGRNYTPRMFARVALLLSFALLIGVPLALRPERIVEPQNAARLIVITPHSEQIRTEFGRAFALWHQREHGEAAYIDFRAPGGTAEIQNRLRAAVRLAVRAGPVRPDGSADRGAMTTTCSSGAARTSTTCSGAR